MTDRQIDVLQTDGASDSFLIQYCVQLQPLTCQQSGGEELVNSLE